MPEQNKQPSENPLEDFADELSQSLDNSQREIDSASVEQVQAGQVWMRNSAARTVNAHALHSEESALGFVRTDAFDGTKSAMGVTIAQEAHLNESTSSVLIARTAHAKNSHSVLLIAGRIEGDVKSVLTPLTAFVAGAGIGTAVYLLRRLFKK